MMPTFTPPTYEAPFLPETHCGYPEKYAVMRFYSYPVGYSVLITGGVATDSPGTTAPTPAQIAAADSGSGENGKAWFRGGIEYAVTSTEQTILEAAGFTVED